MLVGEQNSSCNLGSGPEEDTWVSQALLSPCSLPDLNDRTYLKVVQVLVQALVISRLDNCKGRIIVGLFARTHARKTRNTPLSCLLAACVRPPISLKAGACFCVFTGP
ncbi:unnamed protein product, partial [Pleuronectes platessa]